MIKSEKVNQKYLKKATGCAACKSCPSEINIITICKERGEVTTIALCDSCYTKL